MLQAEKAELVKRLAKTGRPPMPFCQDTANIICDLIATSSKSIYTLCKEHPELPNHQTINTWLWKYRDLFLDQYLNAKAAQQMHMIEESEALLEDVLYYYDNNGNKRIDTASLAKQVAKVQMRKWHASKLMPKLYGDKTILETHNKHDDVIREKVLALQVELAEKNKKEY